MALYRASKLGFRNLAMGSKKLLVGNPLPTPVCGKFPNIDVGRRCHNADMRHHSKHLIRNVVTTALASFGTLVGMTAYLTHLETIPYSKRTHLVLLPRQVDKAVAELIFEDYKKAYWGKILPTTHPTTVRVTLIAEKVIKALERGLRDDKIWGGPNYASRWMEPLKALWQGKELVGETSGARYAAQYLEHVNWQVVVVDDPCTTNAIYLGDGKILLFTGLLRHFEASDAEIAAIIGHEVAHVMALHSAEMLTNCLGLDILGLFWNNFVISAVKAKVSTLQRNLSLGRKQELEADYIGMMLMASAGYDPRVAVTVNEKLAELLEDDDDDDWEQAQYTSTHPSGKRRVQSLTEAQEEAMALYRESISTLAIKGR